MVGYLVLKSINAFDELTPCRVFDSEYAAERFVQGKYLEEHYEALSILEKRISSWYELPMQTQIGIYEVWWPCHSCNYYIEEIPLVKEEKQ